MIYISRYAFSSFLLSSDSVFLNSNLQQFEHPYVCSLSWEKITLYQETIMTIFISYIGLTLVTLCSAQGVTQTAILQLADEIFQNPGTPATINAYASAQVSGTTGISLPCAGLKYCTTEPGASYVLVDVVTSGNTASTGYDLSTE